jgi:hypothetical protein
VSRETIEQKAGRYLLDGRLEVTYVRESPLRVSARCRGSDGHVYSVGRDGSGWFCSCPARVARCAHVVALQLVTGPSWRA